MEIVSSNVIFVSQDDKMKQVVKTMVDGKISSVLVCDKDEVIVGILTERDIVRKFTLLDLADKMTRNVSTIMTRGVKFAKLKTLEEDIRGLHLSLGVRHFPILNGDKPVKSAVVGIVSISDYLRKFLRPNADKKQSEMQKDLIPLHVVGQHRVCGEYQKVFEPLGYAVSCEVDFNHFLRENHGKYDPLIIDLDGMETKELPGFLGLCKKYPGHCILTTSQPALVQGLRSHFDIKKHVVVLKPIDVSYCHFLLSDKWGEKD